eukprot:UN19609
MSQILKCSNFKNYEAFWTPYYGWKARLAKSSQHFGHPTKSNDILNKVLSLIIWSYFCSKRPVYLHFCVKRKPLHNVKFEILLYISF